MASPFNYSVSSFIISNLDNTDNSENDYEDESNFNDLDEDTYEYSLPSDLEANTLESDSEENDHDILTMDEYHFLSENIDETDEVSGNSNLIDLSNSDYETDEDQTAENETADVAEKQPDENETVDEHQKCPICLAAWTNVGSHRLSSLRCGHLFGYKCIKQWLTSENESAKKCPQCNAKALARHIRFIYANKLTSIDNSELEKMKKQCQEANLKYLEISKALTKQKQRTRKYKRLCKRLKR